MGNILLSIVIPARNSEKTIGKLLASINNSDFKNFKNIEAIIVDDCSSDPTVSVTYKLIPHLKFKTAILSLRKHVGPAKARNLGVKNTKGKFVFFLDSDVILFKNTLKNAFNLIKDGKVKAFTGIWDWRQKTPHYFPQFKALRDWAYWFVEREVGYRYYLFSTRVAGMEKKLFHELGGFNEDYKEPTVEDIDLTYRIERAHRIKFCPDIVVCHEFEDFWPIAIKYFKRSRDWIQLFAIRQRFDPVATSRREALKPTSLGLTIIVLLLYLITKNIFFIYVSLICFIFFIFLEIKFLRFLLKKKGVTFMIKSIPTAIILYFVIGAGSVWGILKSEKTA